MASFVGYCGVSVGSAGPVRRVLPARRVTCFDQKVFIKSFSAIIFPMLQVADCVVWHLLSNGTSHISYVDPRIRHLMNQSQTEVGVFDLATSRHILGWSSNVKSYAGIEPFLYKHDVAF